MYGVALLFLTVFAGLLLALDLQLESAATEYLFADRSLRLRVADRCSFLRADNASGSEPGQCVHLLPLLIPRLRSGRSCCFWRPSYSTAWRWKSPCGRSLPRHQRDGQRRMAQDARLAGKLTPQSAGGARTVLLIGNSLLEQGVDRQELQERMRPHYAVSYYPIEGTTYLDWLYGLRRLFAGGARPSAVVLCISDAATAVERHGRRGVCISAATDARSAPGRSRWSPRHDDRECLFLCQ